MKIFRVKRGAACVQRRRQDERVVDVVYEFQFLAGYPNPEEEVLSAVDVKTTGTAIEIGAVRLLFKARMTPFWSRYPYCVSTDGQRVLVETTIGPPVQPTVNLFVNWTAALRR